MDPSQQEKRYIRGAGARMAKCNATSSYVDQQGPFCFRGCDQSYLGWVGLFLCSARACTCMAAHSCTHHSYYSCPALPYLRSLTD